MIKTDLALHSQDLSTTELGFLTSEVIIFYPVYDFISILYSRDLLEEWIHFDSNHNSSFNFGFSWRFGTKMWIKFSILSIHYGSTLSGFTVGTHRVICLLGFATTYEFLWSPCMNFLHKFLLTYLLLPFDGRVTIEINCSFVFLLISSCRSRSLTLLENELLF